MSVRLDLPPPPFTARGGGGGNEWVVLLRAENDIDAHLLSGRLAEAGIETRTSVDRTAPGAWLYGGSNPWAPVTVFVRRLQLEEARVVLAEISFVAPSVAPGSLPSPRARRSVPLLWWLTALALGVFMTIIGLAEVAQALSPCRTPRASRAPQSSSLRHPAEPLVCNERAGQNP